MKALEQSMVAGGILMYRHRKTIVMARNQTHTQAQLRWNKDMAEARMTTNGFVVCGILPATGLTAHSLRTVPCNCTAENAHVCGPCIHAMGRYYAKNFKNCGRSTVRVPKCPIMSDSFERVC